ncbi:MAG: hypothetical protein IJ228_05365 [Succinivibrio sp.]|nr:hypothetical protein [Succinivibrio sp.]
MNNYSVSNAKDDALKREALFVRLISVIAADDYQRSDAPVESAGVTHHSDANTDPHDYSSALMLAEQIYGDATWRHPYALVTAELFKALRREVERTQSNYTSAGTEPDTPVVSERDFFERVLLNIDDLRTKLKNSHMAEERTRENVSKALFKLYDHVNLELIRIDYYSHSLTIIRNDQSALRNESASISERLSHHNTNCTKYAVPSGDCRPTISLP